MVFSTTSNSQGLSSYFLQMYPSQTLFRQAGWNQLWHLDFWHQALAKGKDNVDHLTLETDSILEADNPCWNKIDL